VSRGRTCAGDNFSVFWGDGGNLPFAVRAQPEARVPTIGFLGPATPSVMNEWVTAFVQRLSELHWVVGNTVAIEYRWAEGRNDRLTEFADEFVRLKVDAFVTGNAAGSRADAGDIVYSDCVRGGRGPDCQRSRQVLGATWR